TCTCKSILVLKQRYKPKGSQFLFLELLFRFSHKQGHDLLIHSNGNHQSSPYLKLGHQGFGHLGGTCRYYDTIKWGFFWKTFISVPKNHFLGTIVHFIEKEPRFFK